MTRFGRTITGMLACLAAAGASGEAGADVLVPGTTFDFALASYTTAGEGIEEHLFWAARTDRETVFVGGVGNVFFPLFGGGELFYMNVFEEETFDDERVANGYQLIFLLDTGFADLFPIRPDIGPYAGRFGIGIDDALDLTGTFRLTAATLEFQDYYYQRVALQDVLTGSGIRTDIAWDGRFPGTTDGTGIPDIAGRDISVAIMRLYVERFTPTAPDPRLAALPEPAAWAMLTVGFGLVGGAMRRRPRAGCRLS